MAQLTRSTIRNLRLRVGWTTRRARSLLARSEGAANAALIACATVLLGSALALHSVRQHRQSAESPIVAEVVGPAVTAVVAGSDTARLEAFSAVLPAQTEIPKVLRELIDRAESQGVNLARGSYQTINDSSGEFVKFRMIHPVTGSAEDVHRYVVDSLRMHRALALEGVQFRRQDGRAAIVEARIQWVVFARPINGAGSPGAAQ